MCQRNEIVNMIVETIVAFSNKSSRSVGGEKCKPAATVSNKPKVQLSDLFCMKDVKGYTALQLASLWDNVAALERSRQHVSACLL